MCVCACVCVCVCAQGLGTVFKNMVVNSLRAWPYRLVRVVDLNSASCCHRFVTIVLHIKLSKSGSVQIAGIEEIG